MSQRAFHGYKWLVGSGLALFGVWVFMRAELLAPRPSQLLQDRHGQFLAQLGGDDVTGYGYWPLEHLPARVVAATLALEDRRFHYHPGIDPLAVARAAWQNLRSERRVSGASTIAMQVARMQSQGPRSYPRKAMEALIAVALTLRYGRDAVLGHYLRLVPYGNQSHGIAHAARLYLDKPVDDLSWAEIAFLAAIPQAPGLTNPFTESGRARAKRRGHRILEALHEDGLLSPAEHALATSQLRRLHRPVRHRRPASALHAILKLERRLSRSTAGGDRPEPLVRTTLDLDLQRTVSELAGRHLAHWRSHGANNTAAVVLRRATGEVLAWLGSNDYSDRVHAGSIDYASIERSPGSTLKPFIYAMALEQGLIRSNSVLDDLNVGVAGILNADHRFLGPQLPRQALANSRNVPAVRLLRRVGLDEAYWLLQGMGLHSGQTSARHYGLGLAIGALPTTLERLIGAYGALANDGLQRDLVWYQGQSKPKPSRIFSAATARLISLFLADPQARLPSFPRMGTTEYPFPVALKTGTSQGYRDAWTVAYSREFLVGVWVGRADAGPMRRLGGAGSAAQLAQAILLRLHREHPSDPGRLSFPPPPDHVAQRICAYTGARAAPACERVFTEWFPADRRPAADDGYIRVAVDARNGLRATPWTPRGALQVRAFVELPPRYRAWATANGMPLAPRDYSPLRGPQANATNRVAPAIDVPRSVDLRITYPEDGLHLLSNPDAPKNTNTLPLTVVSDPPVAQVVWYVDGKPFKLAEAPHTARWPLARGEHRIEARLPNRPERSRSVRITVD